MEDFKEGDVVILKSGSPKMTIDKIGHYSNVKKAKCQWFDGNQSNSALFPLHSLEKV